MSSTPCALSPSVCEGTADNVLVLYSLSKQSNMAGYRTAFIAGDYRLVHAMSDYRKQIGQIIPGPVQAAMGCRDCVIRKPCARSGNAITIDWHAWWRRCAHTGTVRLCRTARYTCGSRR